MSFIFDTEFRLVYHSNMHLNVLAKYMRTAGEERRLNILCYLLRHKQRCVSEIAHDLHMSIATTSHHLQVMAKDYLVIAIREGKRIWYTLPQTPFLKGLVKFICSQVTLK